MASALLLARVAGLRTEISSSAVLIAFAVAVGVGLFFGYCPARRAAALEPLEALRHE